MISLSNFEITNPRQKKGKRCGRGIGSGLGKTSGRGQKGAGSRSGYKRRHTYEGGQFRLFQKLPVRGFTRGRFEKPLFSINLDLIEKRYEDGEVVNFETLIEKGITTKKYPGGIKILSNGTLSKKVTIEAHKFSQEAIRKLEENKISYKIIG